jgi:hypothetical protein
VVAQLVDLIEHVGIAVENPHRYVVEAREHDYVFGFRESCDTALREADVNTRPWILQ